MTVGRASWRTGAEMCRRPGTARRLRSLVSDEATVSAYILDVARDGAPARGLRARTLAPGTPSVAPADRGAREPAAA
jgi:hypothetical protein